MEAIAPPHRRTLPFQTWRGVGHLSGSASSCPEEITHPTRWGLMADGIVGWHFFDAEAGIVPEELRPSILPRGGKGRIVVLAATPLAQAEGWASRAVVAIARGWAQEDLRIFLMDLGLDAPSLHKALGLPNREGVSDAFLYGASVQRIAQPALDDAIFFAPAGTATTDPAQILGHLRWNLRGGCYPASLLTHRHSRCRQDSEPGHRHSFPRGAGGIGRVMPGTHIRQSCGHARTHGVSNRGDGGPDGERGPW